MKIFLFVLLILPLITACASGPSKGQLDDEVRRLCAIDGGIKVYETVTLPASRFDEYGNIKIKSKKYAKSTDEYYLDTYSVLLKEGNPRLMRINSKVIRSSDQKIMGEFTQYGRGGGDLPGPWHGSSFSCPPLPSKLESSIFLKEK